jgi:CRP-like cAMP-binding protein
MKLKKNVTFNAQAFLDSAGIARKIVEYRRDEVIFTQGDPCEHVLYIQKGNVKLSVLSKSGREAVDGRQYDPAGRQGSDGASPPPAACAVGSLHRAHAGAEHPD